MILIFDFISVVVEANKDAPALDAETGFFLQDKTFLGKVKNFENIYKNSFHCIVVSDLSLDIKS